MTKMKDEGFAAEEISEGEKADRLEAVELEADPEVVVPTGDEAQPVAGTDHEASLKTLYAKGRRNRELTTREDAEAVADVDMMQRMVSEASGGDTNAAEQLDTNRDMDEAERQELAARIAAEEGEPTGEEEIVKEDAGEAPSSLPAVDPDARVQVKILGKEYEVPQQDIDDAGGVELYQKIRAANVKLQRASILEQQALQAKKEAQELTESQLKEADPPPPDGQGIADINSLRDELLDTVVEGTEDDINKWLESHIRPAKASTPRPETPAPAVIPAAPIISETQEELRRQFNDDRQETNDMMRTQYSDIMGDPELQGLAQQRFQVLATRNDSEGRSQKEIARESAEYVRSLGKRILGDQPAPVSAMEQERRTRIERKRLLPQPSRADSPAPDTRTPERKVPDAKEHIQRLRRHAGQEPPL